MMSTGTIGFWYVSPRNARYRDYSKNWTIMRDDRAFCRDDWKKMIFAEADRSRSNTFSLNFNLYETLSTGDSLLSRKPAKRSTRDSTLSNLSFHHCVNPRHDTRNSFDSIARDWKRPLVNPISYRCASRLVTKRCNLARARSLQIALSSHCQSRIISDCWERATIAPRHLWQPTLSIIEARIR